MIANIYSSSLSNKSFFRAGIIMLTFLFLNIESIAQMEYRTGLGKSFQGFSRGMLINPGVRFSLHEKVRAGIDLPFNYFSQGDIYFAGFLSAEWYFTEWNAQPYVGFSLGYNYQYLDLRDTVLTNIEPAVIPRIGVSVNTDTRIRLFAELSYRSFIMTRTLPNMYELQLGISFPLSRLKPEDDYVE